MDAVVSKMPAHDLALLLVLLTALVVGLIIAVTALLTTNWRRVRQLDIEGSLKQDMLQRGMNAEDIERIIRASSVPVEKASTAEAADSFGNAAASRSGLLALNDKQLAAKVASDLAVYEMDTEMMEEALQALHHADLDTKQAVAQAVTHMTENGAEHEQILAAIVKLCAPVGECCPQR